MTPWVPSFRRGKPQHVSNVIGESQHSSGSDSGAADPRGSAFLSGAEEEIAYKEIRIQRFQIVFQHFRGVIFNGDPAESLRTGHSGFPASGKASYSYDFSSQIRE